MHKLAKRKWSMSLLGYIWFHASDTIIWTYITETDVVTTKFTATCVIVFCLRVAYGK